MKLFDSLFIAFGMYSRIPVPRPEWKKDSMEYIMCFFPLVGVAMGALLCGALWICRLAEVPRGLVAALGTVLPLWLTGGIHMDGYLDTLDALGSWGDREKKLAILKDSRVGAAAVTGCGIYLILSFGAWFSVELSRRTVVCICLGYFLSRALSGLAVVVFPKAKKEGSLAALFSEASRERTARIVLSGYILLTVLGLIAAGGVRGLLLVLVTAAVYAYYYRMSKRTFGGITGDLAGYFLQLCELAILCVAACIW